MWITCIFALLAIGISHVQCARIIDKHNSLLSRQPGASSFGDAIGKALNKKLSQEFGPGWKSYIVPSNDTKQTNYRKYLRANNFTSSGIKIPKDVKPDVDEKYVKENQVALYDTYDEKRQVYIITTEALELNKKLSFDYSLSSADDRNRCRVLDGKKLPPMDQAITEAGRKKLHYQHDIGEDSNNYISLFEVQKVRPVPLECSITGFASVFTFAHSGFEIEGDSEALTSFEKPAWWRLYETANLKVSVETQNVAADFRRGSMIRSIAIVKKIFSKSPSVNEKNSYKETLFQVYPLPSSKGNKIILLKDCKQFLRTEDEHVVVTTLVKSGVSFQILHLRKDSLKIYISSFNYEGKPFLNVWIHNLGNESSYVPAEMSTKQVCTTSSADSYTECKTPKPRVLRRCNRETNSEFSTFGAKSGNEHQSKSSIASVEVPKLKEVKKKCSHVKNIVANSNCVSNMLRAPSHEVDIMSIAENEAIGYKISKDGIDSEVSDRIKSYSQQQFQEINKRIKTTNPWEIKIFYNYESDDNSTEKWKLLKTVNRYGFQVVSDTIGVPSSVTANNGKSNKRVQYKFVQSTDSCKCCRDLFIRSAIAT